MVKLPISPLEKHIQKWENCQKCDYCHRRRQVVFLKGKIPCDFLFIGEAPGEFEDLRGKPFFGPAGRLLQAMIDESPLSRKYRLAFGNVLGCIPRDSETGAKIETPDKKNVLACTNKLREMVAIAKPKIIVSVGRVSGDHIPDVFPDYCLESRVHHILHPAAILKTNTFQKLEYREKTAKSIHLIFQNALENVTPGG